MNNARNGFHSLAVGFPKLLLVASLLLLAGVAMAVGESTPQNQGAVLTHSAVNTAPSFIDWVRVSNGSRIAHAGESATIQNALILTGFNRAAQTVRPYAFSDSPRLIGMYRTPYALPSNYNALVRAISINDLQLVNNAYLQ